MKYEINKINVAVLAGGTNRIALYEDYSPGYKGLILLEKKTMIQFVLNTLGNVPQVERTCIVGPEDIRQGIEDPSRYEYAPAGKSLRESIFNGLRHFNDSPSVLFIPADLPLITPSAVSDFLKTCERTETPYDVFIFWAVVPEESFTGPFIKVTKGFNRFRDVSVCHGNLFLITPSVLKNERITPLIDKIYDARKSSIKAALKVGLRIGLKYAIGVHFLRLVTLDHMARSLSRYLKMGIVPVFMDYPEVTVDIDNYEDYVFVLENISGLNSRKNDIGTTCNQCKK